ncbi:MAG: radical SAM protein [Candidatus Buchananbacteria bacterium]
MSTIKSIFSRYRSWLIIAAAFLAVRILVFITFWQASVSRGGWQNFYNQAQPAVSVLLGIFHDYCDWHPPLYYMATSVLLHWLGGEWMIYLAQVALAFVTLFIGYKLIRLFFSERISLLVTFLVAIEPYWAWHNFLLVSENLAIPLFLGGVYYFLKFFLFPENKQLMISGLLLGLSTLVRQNTSPLMAILPVFLILAYVFRKILALKELERINWRKIVLGAAAFILVFAAVISPILIKNKIVYQRLTLVNLLATNIYFYNLPALISYQKQIPYADAYNLIVKQADDALGANIGNQGDCLSVSLPEFNRELDYYSQTAKTYILGNFADYLKVHLIRTVPFFFQPGYFEMWSAYTGEFSKPDITGFILNGNWQGIFDFLKQINLKLLTYFSGIALWGICSVALLAALVYSCFKDRDKLLFFVFSAMIILYTALMVSPFVLARYRLPVYIFFFSALAYCCGLLLVFLKKNKHQVKKIIKAVPIISPLAKLFYDWRRDKLADGKIKKFIELSELPFKTVAPPIYEIGYEPTIKCNLRCKMCYQGENRNLRQQELSTEQILEVFKKISGKTKEIKLVGGEPFARQDILELIAFWDSLGKRVILQTNCTLINEDNIDRLAEYKHLTDILTSLDGPKELHDAIRGVPGTFDRLERALGLLRVKMPQVPITIFATLLINDNVDNFFELIDTTKKLGITTINVLFEQVYSAEEVAQTKNIFNQEFGWEDGRDYRLNTQVRNPIFPSDLDAGELKKKLAKIRSYGLKNGCFVNFSPFNYYHNLPQYLGRQPARPFCLKLLQPELRINQRGEVVWCDIIEKSFGNLLDKTPDEIWLSDDYQKFRQYLFKHSLSVCSRCCKAVYINN